jgi:hypothetical protein
MNPTLQLILWVLLSLGLGIGGLMVLRSGRSDAASAPSVIGEVAPFVYFIGLPFMAVITGGLSLDLLGLGTDWFTSGHIAGFEPGEWMLGLGATVSTVAFVLVVLWAANRTARNASTAPAMHSLLSTLRDATYAEVHWAFYRAPFVLLFDDAFWGVVAGCALIVIEVIVHAQLSPSRALRGNRDRLLLACCLLTSSLLYLATRNLWLMIAAHVVIQRVGEGLLTPPTTSPPLRAS